MKQQNDAIVEAKDKFLWWVGCAKGDYATAIYNAFLSAVRRGYVYAGDERGDFPWELKERVRICADDYRREPITSEQHCDNIAAICGEMSAAYGRILRGGVLRVGTCQKVLNVNLKYLWCMDELSQEPPHCPVDSIVLQAANIRDVAWTQIASIGEYLHSVGRIERYLLDAGRDDSLSVWELLMWNDS